MHFLLRSLSVFLVLGLCACATVFERAIQDIEIVTPGAENAKCYVDANSTRYVVYPPQSVTIAKSDQNLKVTCLAPGNRKRELVIAPDEADSAFGNFVWGGVGYGVDHATGALYKFPDTISVDFTTARVSPEALPDHNAADLRPPESYDLEEFMPAQPRLNADKDEALPVLLPREKPVKVLNKKTLPANP